MVSQVELALTQSDHQGEDAPGQKNNTYSRGQFLAAFGLDADFRVADLYIVILAVRNRHDERQQSEYQQQGADNRKVLHIPPQRIGFR